MGMKWYVVRRVMWAVVATWVALTFTFALLNLTPNQEMMHVQMKCAVQGENIQQCIQTYKQSHNLDTPIIQRYIDYMIGMYTLNWGWSETMHMPVLAAIATAWPYSAQYAIPGIIITAIIGYGFGLYSAFNQYSKSDYAGSFGAFFGISLPEFWYALMLILVFGVMVKEMTLFGVSLAPLGLPVYYNTLIPQQYGWFSWKNIQQLILPTAVLVTTGIGSQLRYARAQALEYVNAEFTKVAKAKGASDRRILVRHIFRMALVPLSTYLVGTVLTLLFAGATIIEIIFQIPGIGYIGYNAIINGDTALVLAFVLIPVFIAIIGNLLQDLAYVALDPRIDYGDR